MNQDESMKCLKLSKERHSQGDFEGALRMAIKAKRMFECTETNEWLENIKTVVQNNTGGNSKDANKEAQDSEEIKRGTESTGNNSKPANSTVRQRTNVQTDSLYTPEQVKDVKEFMKRDKNNYYLVLGIEKSATIDEIKKSYKKLGKLGDLENHNSYSVFVEITNLAVLKCIPPSTTPKKYSPTDYNYINTARDKLHKLKTEAFNTLPKSIQNKKANKAALFLADEYRR